MGPSVLLVTATQLAACGKSINFGGLACSSLEHLLPISCHWHREHFLWLEALRACFLEVLVDCCLPVSEVTGRRQLCSASQHRLTVPRCLLSTFVWKPGGRTCWLGAMVRCIVEQTCLDLRTGWVLLSRSVFTRPRTTSPSTRRRSATRWTGSSIISHVTAHLQSHRTAESSTPICRYCCSS